jgi:hypothetical protein
MQKRFNFKIFSKQNHSTKKFYINRVHNFPISVILESKSPLKIVEKARSIQMKIRLKKTKWWQKRDKIGFGNSCWDVRETAIKESFI